MVSGRARREAGGWTHKTGSMTAVMAFTNMSTPTRFPARVGAVSRVARSAREAERGRESALHSLCATGELSNDTNISTLSRIAHRSATNVVSAAREIGQP